MKTTIDNNSRVFLIHRSGFFTRDYFCNLETIPEILTNELTQDDTFVVMEYWNKKFKRCSKKHLNEMFEAHRIDFKL